MAKLHIVYDPSDRLETSHPEMEKQLGLKVANLSLSGNLTNDELIEYARNLAIMLLEQVMLDEPEDSNNR